MLISRKEHKGNATQRAQSLTFTLMMQIIAIVLLFSGAVFYLGRMLYKAFKPSKTGCEGDCKCESKAALTPKP